jgi:hypothetical protein
MFRIVIIVSLFVAGYTLSIESWLGKPLYFRVLYFHIGADRLYCMATTVFCTVLHIRVFWKKAAVMFFSTQCLQCTSTYVLVFQKSTSYYSRLMSLLK